MARAALGLALVCALGVAVLAAALMLYGRSQQGTAYRGVEVAGVELGGLNQDEAARRIDERIQQVAPQQLTLTYGDQRWSLPSSSLGIHYDASATSERALDFGRSGDLWADSSDWLTGLLHGTTIPVVYEVDDQPAIAALNSLAPEIIRAPRDAQFVVDPSGKLTIDPGVPGVGINVDATLASLRNRFAHLSDEPVSIETLSVPARIQARDLEPGLKAASTMVSKPLTLTHLNAKWQVSQETLSAMFVIDRQNGGAPDVSLSSEMLRNYVSQLATQVRDPGRNATVEWNGASFAVVQASNGEELDADATARAIIASLTKDQHQVEVAVQPVPAAITNADAETAARRATQLAARTINLTWGTNSTTLQPNTLAPAIRFVERPGESTELAVDVDAAVLAQVLESKKTEVEVPAKDAKLRYLDGKVSVVEPEVKGTTLDVQKSAATLKTAFLQGQDSAALTTAPVDPQITAAMAGSISIKERLTSGETYYAGSVANRKFNVEHATQLVNGSLIAPGATFSFNGAVGGIDLAHGFKVGYGIVATSNGSVSTVPSVGGGVCQVSTTLFHAVFWAGMPIVERNWHLYWIPTYGQKPSGLTGLDATVDSDYGLDFQFKNTTDNWLAIVATANGSALRFELWGTNPGWTVDVDDPVISNRVKATTEMQYEESDQLPKGQTVFVEHAEDGFDVGIHRRVSKDGQVLDDVNLRSHYVPSSNVTLVGTGPN